LQKCFIEKYFYLNIISAFSLCVSSLTLQSEIVMIEVLEMFDYIPASYWIFNDKKWRKTI